MTNAKLPSFFADVNESKNILSVLKWSIIKKQDPNNKSINCVARMKYNSQIYWAVNGAPKDVKNPANNAEKLDILGIVLKHFSNKHVVVKLSTTQTSINLRPKNVDPKVYFPSIQKKVSLKKYQQAYISKIKVRLFSCCERKLIAAVNNPNQDSFSIDVIKPPCELCLAAKEYLNNPNFQLNYANFLLVDAYDELHSLNLV